MNIFITYCSILISVNVLHVLGLRYFGLAYIYNEPNRMFGSGFLTSQIVTLILLLVFCTIGYFVTKPFDSIIKKIKKENYIPTEADKIKCLSTYKTLNGLTILASVMGFFVGQLIMILRGVQTGLYDSNFNRILIILAQAIGFGLNSAITVIVTLDRMLAPFRENLKLRSVTQYKKQKSMKVSTSVISAYFISLYFVGINQIAVSYGILINNGGYSYLNKSFACFLISIFYVFFSLLNIILTLKDRIKTTINVMDDVSSRGDISKRIDITVLDDFGILATSINQTMESISEMIVELNNKTADVTQSANVITDCTTTASDALNHMTDKLSKISENSTNQNTLILQANKNIEELTNSVENVKQRVVQQTLSVENISSSVSQMTANIASVAETAKKAQVTSDTLSKTSEEGKNAIENAIVTMKNIQQSSNEVREIITVIQNIAAQTNLLSMNAAIEAAHAGEFGQGFAVVAEEVRNLAESSSKSTKEIQKHISDMADTIDDGVKAISTAGDAFSQIATQVQENAQFVSTISAAMEEQSSGAIDTQKSTVQVVEAVKAVDELTDIESKAAENIKNFMTTVIDASESTMSAVEDSIAATDNLQKSIEQVDESALSNKESVSQIQKHMEHFKI